MGSFLTNYQVKTEDYDKVIKIMEQIAKKSAFVAPAKNGWIAVYDETSEEQDEKELHRVASGLSSSLRCAVFAFLVHDDDVFIYLLYDNGTLIDIYNSVPDYFGTVSKQERDTWKGHPEKLAAYALPEIKEPQIALILKEQRIFALETVIEFVSFFGIDAVRAYFGFNYIGR